MPRIELKVTHTHAGAVYPPGHVLEVDEPTARWLIERRVGRLVETAEAQAGPIGTTSAPAPKRKTTPPNTAQE